MITISQYGGVLKKALKRYNHSTPLVLASSTSFFTVFAIPTIIIIIINSLNLYFDKPERVTKPLLDGTERLFGPKVADQVFTIVSNFQDKADSIWMTVLGAVFLIFVATNLLKIIRLSINKIWCIKVTNPDKIILNRLKKRAIALAIIIGSGILVFLFSIADSIILAIGNELNEFIPFLDSFFVILLTKLLSLATASFWFTMLFRFLPDAKIDWKVLWVSGLITGVLFMIGKFIMEMLLVDENLSSIFAASSSIVLILLFIFYSSLIMYFGAAFSIALSNAMNKKVRLTRYAEHYTEEIISK